MKLFDRKSLPGALRPLTNLQLAVGLIVCLTLLALTGCGGGDASDPEQRKDDPIPHCEKHEGVCQ